MGDTQKGVVKWFNDAKGFGFLEHETGRDVFVHYSVIQGEGFKTLKDGEAVEYQLSEGPKGLHAVMVQRSPEAIAVSLREQAEKATQAQNGLSQNTQTYNLQTPKAATEASATRSIHAAVRVEKIENPSEDNRETPSRETQLRTVEDSLAPEATEKNSAERSLDSTLG